MEKPSPFLLTTMKKVMECNAVNKFGDQQIFKINVKYNLTFGE